MADIGAHRWLKLKLVYTIGVISMNVAFVLFFGQVLNRFQPFFSIVVIVCWLVAFRSLFFRAFRLSRAPKTDGSYNEYLLRHWYITCGPLVASIAVLIFKGSIVYWAALGFFSVGVGIVLLVGIIVRPHMIRKLNSAEVPSNAKEIEQEEQEKATTMAGLVVGMTFVALVYFLLFTPLTVWIAHGRGLNVVDVLLFVNFPGISISQGFWQEVARLLAPSNALFLFSFGVLYGVLACVSVLLRISIRGDNWREFIIISNGILSGYALTIGVSYLLGVTQTLIRASQISFAYVFVVMYLSRVLTIQVSRWGIKTKYEYAIGGIQALTVAWILSRMFGAQSEIFSGLIFYVCTFVTTSLFEILFNWLFGGESTDGAMSSESSLWQTIRFASKEYRGIAIPVAVISSLFPLITYGLLKLVTDAMLP